MIQFARGINDSHDYAIKFFLDPHAFIVEAALYAACVAAVRCRLSPEVAKYADDIAANAVAADPEAATSAPAGQMSAAAVRFLPQVEAVCDGAAGGLADPTGKPLPPCIVMEKGESLHDWSDRAEPDFFTSLAVRSSGTSTTPSLCRMRQTRAWQPSGTLHKSGDPLRRLVACLSTPSCLPACWCVLSRVGSR